MLQPQVDDLLDVMVIDTDALSHIDQTVGAVLATSENEKKNIWKQSNLDELLLLYS